MMAQLSINASVGSFKHYFPNVRSDLGEIPLLSRFILPPGCKYAVDAFASLGK